MTPAGARSDPGARQIPTSWRAGVAAATVVTLAKPQAWPVALAGFMVRGGLVAFVLPIIVLPTMTGLATALGPAVISIALGQPNADVARLIALVVGSLLAWLAVSVLLGAATDVVLIGWIAADLDGLVGVWATRSQVLRVALVRAVAHLPLLLVAGWGLARLVEVTRLELIMPGDLAVPLVLRVAGGAPEVLALLLVAWLAGEALGELAARRVVLEDRTATRALAAALGYAVRHAPGTLATLVVGTLGLVALVIPPVAAAAVAWSGLRTALLGDDPLAVALVGALALSVAWLGALILCSLAATWRSALWTAEVIRSRRAMPAEGPAISGGAALPASAR